MYCLSECHATADCTSLELQVFQCLPLLLREYGA